MDFRLSTLDEITHNCRVKTFPNGRVELIAAPAALFRESGWELADGYEEELSSLPPGEPDRDESLKRARRRARSNVYDLAHANGFDRFVTFTLDRARVDRYDIGEITRKLNVWLDNRVRRGGLRYVLVPELHRDGAVHFHGLINSEALEAVDSGTLTKGGKPRKPRSERSRQAMLADGWQTVWNLPQWTLGFSTAIDLYGDYDVAVGYVCKYISKALEKVGGRWYYSGGDLARPSVAYADVDFEQLCLEYPGGGLGNEGRGALLLRDFRQGGRDMLTETEKRDILAQYQLCRDAAAMLGTGLFECVMCKRVGRCPVYGTKDYGKRQLEYCSFFIMGEGEDLEDYSDFQ